ncbi:MAG TPA: decaprenyl-phosphate phosphoribosyltransferase [Ktedonobacterales bacterium]
MSTRPRQVLDPSLLAGNTVAALPARKASLLGQLPYALRAMRPTQWSKNAVVLAALIFARRLTDIHMVGRTLLAFAAFCLTASAIYLFNDIRDRESDRVHPKKRLRPIASGQLSLSVASGTAVVCALAAAALIAVLVAQPLSVATDPFAAWGGSQAMLVMTLAGYLAVNIAYSSWLKHQVLWDVFIIAAGFVARALAGAFAAPVPISPWFYLCTLFLALFLALGKRRAELIQLGASGEQHRQNLREYSVLLLDQLLAVVVTCTLITYSLYTFQSETASHALMITIPFVIFGMFRYLYLIYVKGEGGQPDEVLWRDRQVLASVFLCGVAVVILLYVLPMLHRHVAGA